MDACNSSQSLSILASFVSENAVRSWKRPCSLSRLSITYADAFFKKENGRGDGNAGRALDLGRKQYLVLLRSAPPRPGLVFIIGETISPLSVT